ncbi:CDP-glucose 4,6-dehydratase, partial [Desulfovibrio sp. 1188_IL3213]
MFANAYKGRRVFVTGHTGFKGSWMAAWLSQLGAVVGGFSDEVPTEPSHYAAMNLGAHLE